MLLMTFLMEADCLVDLALTNCLLRDGLEGAL
jgi:hypothetical protein